MADQTRIRRPVTVLLVLSFLAGTGGGCAYRNLPLDDASKPLAARARNYTRSALAPRVPPGPIDALADASGLLVTDAGADPSLAPPPPSPRDDGCFIGVAISGGGLRSANFSAACLLELERIGLLQYADYISAVSGGAITAAYYCSAPDDQWNAERVWRRLTFPFMNDMLIAFVQPWHWGAMLTTPYDRGDLLATTLDRQLYRGAYNRSRTFADLRADRPGLLINATDLQSGQRFVFCDEHFDRLNSDLSRYPLAFAVAASSADPIMLHAVTVRDYSGGAKRYRHLIDGGITDNLGVRTLVQVYEHHNKLAADAGRAPPYPHGAIVVVLDARTHFNNDLTSDPDLGMLEMLGNGMLQAGSLLLNNSSDATLADLLVRTGPDDATLADTRRLIDEFHDTGYIETMDRRHLPVRVAHFALRRAEGCNGHPGPGFQTSLDDIPTSLNITQADARRLYRVANLLMSEKFEAKLRPIVQDLRRRAAPRPNVTTASRP